MKTTMVVFLSILSLAACSGGGGASSAPAPTPGSKLFVSDRQNAAIGSLVNSNPSAGSMVVDRIISGTQTQFDGGMNDLAIDPVNDRLYVGNAFWVKEFDHASTATGNIPQSRIVYSGLTHTFSLDTVHDTIYMGEVATHINVINTVSSQLPGSMPLTPSRIITVSSLEAIQGISTDSNRNILYVLNLRNNDTISEVDVFDNANSINGTVVANRVITIAMPVLNCGIFLDAANDRLYVSTVTGHILVYNNASTVTGSASPDRDITLPVPNSTKITIDTVNNRLYAVSPTLLSIVNNASTVSGAVGATEMFVGFPTSYTGVAVKP